MQEGDTINSIADANGITPEELMQLNDMTDSSQLQVGQTLTIRAESISLPQKVEGLRGYLSITIYKQPNGSQRAEYLFNNIANTFPYITLTGENLEPLQAYQSRPVDIWGTIELKDGQLVLNVDRYEIPFPDLQFKILRGRQQRVTLEGQSAILFNAEDGTSYVQMAPDGTIDMGILGNEGDELLMETLAVPDETLGGYPALRVFSASMATNPKDGLPMELTVTADQINTYDEPVVTTDPYTPPALIIEKIELMYYITNPHWQAGELSGGQPYIQPAWRFFGHYENGDEFELIVQALTLEYLLPELAPFTPPG